MKKLLLFLVMGCLLAQPVNAQLDSYLVTETNPSFKFTVCPIGYGINASAYSTRDLELNELNSLLAASQTLHEILNDRQSIPVNFYVIANDILNASAIPKVISFNSDQYFNTSINMMLNRDIDLLQYNENYIVIGKGLDGNNLGWGTYTEPFALYQSYSPDLYSVSMHELFHSLGVVSLSNAGSGTTFDPNGINKMIFWDSFLRVAKPILDNSGSITDFQEVAASPTVPIIANRTPVTDTIDNFDVYNYAPYFVGIETMKILTGTSDNEIQYMLDESAIEYMQDKIVNAGGLKNHAYSYTIDRRGDLPIGFGLPVNSYEGNRAEFSHIELRNGFMSHQPFRNWYTPMEAELGVLKDLGYTDIKVRDYFGKSYYLDNQTETWSGDNNHIGYAQWDDSNKTYLSDSYSTITNGVGLHIYSSHNNIKQDSNIFSKGLATIGVRIDGEENQYTLNSDSIIETIGDNSIALATTYGKNHVLNIEKDSTINATGKNGIGLSFDFGQNALGSTVCTKGSYTYYDSYYSNPNFNVQIYEPEINGALAKDVNINGKINATQAAVYIADNAHVENINISETAEINGDIISNWNSINVGPSATTQLDETKYTNINFILDSTSTSNTPFNKLNGNIIGNNEIQNTLKFNVKSGVLEFNNTAQVDTVHIANGAELTGNARYITNALINEGTFSILKNTDINTNLFQNNGRININEDYTLSNNISGIRGFSRAITTGEISLNSGTLSLSENVDTIDSTLAFRGGNLNLIDGTVKDISFNGIDIYENGNLDLDLDLNTQEIDTISFQDENNIGRNSLDGNISISDINLMNYNDKISKNEYRFSFLKDDSISQKLINNISVNIPNKQFYTPIYKYSFGKSITEPGVLLLSRGASNDYRGYNPAVLTSSVATQIGGYLTQLQAFDMAFGNMDMTMLMDSKTRQALKFKNKYAMTGVQSGNNLITFNPNQLPEESKGLWFKPYATFEKVNLSSGPNVENQSYGSFFGGDSEIISLKHGWDAVFSGYAGYTGSHQNYDGISIYQNGGMLGASGVFYKGNFFTGLTTNVGASAAEANNMYGSEDITMLMTGIASKSGYNWELANNKFIIQPSWLMSYSFINTFNYHNAAGVGINSDPLHAIQLVPGLKFIGNLNNGWQPYATVQMVWNIMDKTRFQANNTSLPQMSVDPYVQYGVGVQKRWGERFTGYGQTLVRNGGRNGVSLSFGFRWAIGK